MRTPLRSVLVAFLLGISHAHAQLPPEIMVDRHLVRAERLLAGKEAVAALQAMNEVLALQEEHDLELGNRFHFQYAPVAFAAGRTEAAIASLTEYLIAAGRDGEFYREALQLLDAAEVRLPEDERAPRWPPGRVFRDREVCPEMVVLPVGGLALGRYEVTAGEHRAFAPATGAAAGGRCEAFPDGGDSRRGSAVPRPSVLPIAIRSQATVGSTTSGFRVPRTLE